MPSVFYEKRCENQFVGAICDHPFPAHVHDLVEIICLKAGRLAVSISGQRYQVEPGDVAVVFPAIPHSYDEVSADVQGLTLIFLPDTITEFTNAFRTQIPTIPILRRGDKPAMMDTLIDQLLVLGDGEENPLQTGYLHLFLSYLFTCLPLQHVDWYVQTSAASGMGHQALQYISRHYTEQLTLESTAHALGVSRIHLSHIFSQQLGINFRQYINNLRIDRACTLLRNPAYSITQISDLCGYNNLRTFRRAFTAQCSISPSRYRAYLLGQDETVQSDMG